jgi:small-conductance mechanosensitive channel
MVLGILAATLAVQRLVTAAVLARGKKARAVPVSLLAAALRIVVILTGALVIFQSLGVSVTPFVTALGIGGLAVALALQDTLANLFAGIHILASGQVRRGDYVKLDSGEEGYVDDITWRNTSIRMLANNTVIVPNTKLASSTVVNYYRPAKELSVRVPVGVSYESDLERVEQVTLEVAHEALREVPGGVADFKPWVLFTAFADFSVNLLVVLRVREYVDQYLMIHEFVKRLHRRYAEEGIVIPFPIRTVHLKGDADHGPDVRAACPSAGPKGAQAGAGGD